jgi:cell wall-associated NlpC family hydrolase
MNFIAVLLITIGGYLTTTSLKNRNPKATLIAFMQGKPLPTTRWYVLPERYGIQGSIWARQPAPSSSDVLGDVQGGPRQPQGSKRSIITQYALAQAGERYVFGAAGPDTWDCSGLTMRAYQQAGIHLPHHAASQQTMGRAITEANAQPGDLVFWGPLSGHVAIYLGNGQVVHAPKTGDVVRTAALWDKKNVRFRSYL